MRGRRTDAKEREQMSVSLIVTEWVKQDDSQKVTV